MVKVSVEVITYNHGKFISKALDSILMQQTNFDYEILVGEDCSTDNTREILLQYQKKYPHRFRLFLNDENLGMHRNSLQVLEACKGKYIASLEGDDYWISPRKLQKQVDFLDSHPECSACFHDALIVHEDGSSEPVHYRPSQKAFNTVEDLLIDNFIPTCSVLFRRGLTTEDTGWVSELKMGDWPFHILHALHGSIAYLDETMAVYMVHPGGVWSMKSRKEHETAIIQFFEALARHLEPRYVRIIRRILRFRYLSLSRAYERTGELAKARTLAAKSLRKHLSVMRDVCIYGSKEASRFRALLPSYFDSAKNTTLVKTFLRLYLLPMVQRHAPLLLGLCRLLARSFNVRLWKLLDT